MRLEVVLNFPEDRSLLLESTRELADDLEEEDDDEEDDRDEEDDEEDL